MRCDFISHAVQHVTPDIRDAELQLCVENVYSLLSNLNLLHLMIFPPVAVATAVLA